MPDLVAKNPARRNIVSVAEAAGDCQDLMIRRQPWIFQQPIEVHHLRLSSGRSKLIEGESVRNQRGRLEPRVVCPHDFLADRIGDEEDMTNPIPVIEFDREERWKNGQGRPL